jgi:hypothetical protein
MGGRGRRSSNGDQEHDRGRARARALDRIAELRAKGETAENGPELAELEAAVLSFVS